MLAGNGDSATLSFCWAQLASAVLGLESIEQGG